MNSFFLGVTIAATLFAACKTGSDNADATSKAETPSTLSTTAPYTPPAGVDAQVATSLKPVIDGYLKLKNALAADNSNSAAAAGKSIVSALAGVNTTAMTATQQQTYSGLLADISEHAEHTGANGGNIVHQREHFEMLSKDMYDLVKTFGGGQKLYYAHCPMAFDNKGASWVSETEEIKNPYFGDEMLECGEVKEELK